MSGVMAFIVECVYLGLCAKLGVSRDVWMLGFAMIWAGCIASIRD